MLRSRLLEKLPLGLFVLTVFTYCFNALKESDVFYHLAAGKLIWEAGAIPYVDQFSYLAEGAPWVAHEWLSQLLAYGVYVLGGYWGLMAAVALLGVATFVLVTRIADRVGTPRAFTMLAALLLGSVAFSPWIARPQVIAYLFCALLVFLLERYRRDGARWILAACVGVLWLWANMHAGFILGIVIMGWYAVSLLIAQRFRIGDAQVSARTAWLLVAATGAAILLCLVNPTGYHAFFYAWYIRPAADALNIIEWKSILAFSGFAERASVALITASALFAAYWYGYRRESRQLTYLGMVLGISILPFISVRHQSFWVVAALPFVIAGLGVWLQPRFTRENVRLVTGLLIGLCALLLLGRLATFPREYFYAYRIPVHAADFAERVGIGRMFNLYNEGGYLIWRRWPGQQVSIDGRSEVYAGRPLNEFLRIVSVTPTWNELVDEKYQIDAFFLAYNPPQLHDTIRPLLAKLKADGWVPVYWDDLIVMYVRNDAKHQALIAQYGLQYADPFGDPEQVPVEDAKKVAAEVQRLVELSSMNSIPLEYARRVLVHAEQVAQ